MGSDDLHKKRKLAKSRAKARMRVVKERRVRTRILVLTEGETEEEYISKLAESIKDKITVDTSSNCPTCPLGIARKAIELKKYDKDYDAIFLVFDLDVVSAEKLNEVEQIANSNSLTLIKTDPCFEYWLLLHFHFTTQPYERLPDKSPCHQVVSDLKKIEGMESYDKVASMNTPLLISKTLTAITHSKRSLEQSKEIGKSNPSTNMHELVQYITSPPEKS